MLKPEEWKPSTKLSAVLEFARQLLKGTFALLSSLFTRSAPNIKRRNTQANTIYPEPNPDDAVEVKIADQYKTDRAGYEREAKDWTKRYASKKH